MIRLLLCAAAVVAMPASAATLRSVGSIEGASVRIADLFDGAGSAGDRVLGPGPAPGARIVVEAPQLAAIARQFGVDWRPSSPADRAVLERPGRVLPREEVLAALRAALPVIGDGDMELPGFAAPVVPLEGRAEVVVEQADYDAGNGRFTATLAVSAPDMVMQRQRVSGRVVEMAELPVPVRRLEPGSVVSARDLRMTRVRAPGGRAEVARLPEEAIGLALRHAALPGQPISLAELQKPVLVARGARVSMQLSTGGLSVTAQGVAMQAGGAGERIRVQNPYSRAVVEAEVIGPDQVRVMPGSMPLAQPRAQVAGR